MVCRVICRYCKGSAAQSAIGGVHFAKCLSLPLLVGADGGRGLQSPGSCHNADHGDASDDDGGLQGTVVDHGSFADGISIRGQRAIRSPAVYSAWAVTLRTGRIGSQSTQSSTAAAMILSMDCRWKSAERERVRERIRRDRQCSPR